MLTIDVNALKKLFSDECAGECGICLYHEPCDDDACECGLINNAPLIEADPVRHGRWVRQDETQIMFDVDWKCSECDTQITTSGIFKPAAIGWNFCPGCGAKMDKKEENT